MSPREVRLIFWGITYLTIMRLLLACQPSVTPSNPTDAGDSGTIMLSCEGACNTLKFFGCAEGSSPHCADVLNDVADQKLIRKPDGYPLACSDIALANSATQIRALNISCSLIAGKNQIRQIR
jgi:hypothetical protein